MGFQTCCFICNNTLTHKNYNTTVYHCSPFRRSEVYTKASECVTNWLNSTGIAPVFVLQIPYGSWEICGINYEKKRMKKLTVPWAHLSIWRPFYTLLLYHLIWKAVISDYTDRFVMFSSLGHFKCIYQNPERSCYSGRYTDMQEILHRQTWPLHDHYMWQWGGVGV